MAKRRTEVRVGRGALNAQSLQIVNGIVKAYFPRIGLYTVTLKGQLAHCYSLNYSGGVGLGVYAKGTYAPGESVFCIFNEAMGEGFIIGSHPGVHGSLARNISYPVSGESTIGLNQPNTARGGLIAGPVSGCTSDDNVGINADTHCCVSDLSTGGSFSVSSETGIRFFADPYSMGMQCDDATGLWVYSDDSYMRQSSINFQQIAGGKVEEDYNDNGELNETVGHSMFSWELLGQTEKPVEGDIIKSDGITPGEPVGSAYSVDADAKPFHRVVEYGGYLGHGYQRVVNAPPQTKPDAYKYGTENPDQYCLSRIAQFADGDVSIESAKSIILTKHCYIPSVQTMQVPDDLDGGAGDSSKESNGEYDFSHEDNAELKSAPDFTYTREKTPCELLQELTALIDYQAYLLNYKLVYPFSYHYKDYYVNEEEGSGLPSLQYESWFSTLQSQQFAETPGKIELNIHEKLKSTYYASESGLALLPEGGVSLYGGYGEEVRMGAGTSTFSAPGDIWIKAGRNIHLWAGNDIILKAKNCIDESTTDGSVRIKAEKHLEMLGGNAGSEGGVLIESKSSGEFDFSEVGEQTKIGGLVIRASKGTAVLEGENTYIGSGVATSAGSITIDAGQPNGSINLCGSYINNYISNSFFVAKGTFDSSESGSVSSIFYLEPGKSVESPGTLGMSVNVLNTGSITTKGNILCGESLIVKNNCCTLQNSDGIVSSIADDSGSKNYSQTLENLPNQIKEEILPVAENVYADIVKKLYTEKKAGNADRIANTEFSYRTEQEYGTAYGFQLYADRWQNIAYALDMDNTRLPNWEETCLDGVHNKGLYPYPGDKFYSDDQETCLVYQTSYLYNGEPYVLKPRWNGIGNIPSDEYAEAEYFEPSLESLNHYIIIGGANG